jgi:hypothetical protein
MKIFIAIFAAFLLAGTIGATETKGKMNDKLKIVIPRVNLKNVTIEQALDFLKRTTRDLDVDGEGINFVYYKEKEAKQVRDK